ncbi:MAG: hypothetical protein ABR501_12110 [Pyrinomonadaceae bacterium]
MKHATGNTVVKRNGHFSARVMPYTGYAICFAGFLLCVIAFYPGYLSPDSIRQLTEGRAWNFTDWHPPLMAALWGLTDRVIPGPFGMLLLQNAVFWCALGMFWRSTYRKSIWMGLGLVAIGFLPPVLALLSTIWKDVGLGASLLLVSALLYNARQANSRVALIVASPFLFYAYAVRQNAAPAIFPLALWTGFIACSLFSTLKRRVTGGLILPLLIGVSYFFILTSLVLLTTWSLTRGLSSYIFQTVLLHDLAAISKQRKAAVFPDYVLAAETFSLDNVLSSYDEAQATALTRGEHPALQLTQRSDEIAALRAKWLETVPSHKAIYLRHRWETFRRLIGWNVEVCFPYLATARKFESYDVNKWRIHQFLRAVFWKFRNAFLFRGWLWLLACLVLLCFASVQRVQNDLEVVFVLTLSGLLYGVAYFFIATSCDFRFLWWTVLALSVSICFSVSFAIKRLKTRFGAPIKR